MYAHTATDASCSDGILRRLLSCHPAILRLCVRISLTSPLKIHSFIKSKLQTRTSLSLRVCVCSILVCILQQFSRQRRKNDQGGQRDQWSMPKNLSFMTHDILYEAGRQAQDTQSSQDLASPRIITAAIIKISQTKLGQNAIESFALGNLTPSSSEIIKFVSCGCACAPSFRHPVVSSSLPFPSLSLS